MSFDCGGNRQPGMAVISNIWGGGGVTVGGFIYVRGESIALFWSEFGGCIGGGHVEPDIDDSATPS